MGAGGTSQDLAEGLRAEGMPVVGWDSLRYFWRVKTPEVMAADLALVISSYTARWNATKVLLVGYSFGADVLPTALPPSLLRSGGGSSRSPCSASAGTRNGRFPSAGCSICRKLGSRPRRCPRCWACPAESVQCIYGADETASACRDLAGTAVEVIRMPGGHHFAGDYAGLQRAILAGLTRRQDAAGTPGAGAPVALPP